MERRKLFLVGAVMVICVTVFAFAIYLGMHAGRITFSPTGKDETPPENGSSKTETWHHITSFSGSGDKTTSKFHIPSAEWRITFSCKGEEGVAEKYVYISIWAFWNGDLTELASLHGSGSDTSYCYEGPDDFHLEIGVANLESWSVTVEALY